MKLLRYNKIEYALFHFSKNEPTADLVIFTEEILNGKLQFSRSVNLHVLSMV